MVGLKTDGKTFDLLQKANEQGELALMSHASVKEQVSSNVLEELEKSADSHDVETGVKKFIEWIRSGKLEIKAYPSENLHAKVYIMTFSEDDRDIGRVITGSSNLPQAGLQDNLEFNVELKNRSDYDFAIAKFNELWSVAVDISKPYEDKGAIIDRFQIRHTMSQGEIMFLKAKEYMAENHGKRAHHHEAKRIVMQGITGVNEKIRLKMTIVDEGTFCANSVNYIVLNDLMYRPEYLLALLNSSLLNFIFTKTSTNSNVN